MTLALAGLTVRRLRRESEVPGELENPDPAPPRIEIEPARSAPAVRVHFTPIVAPTVTFSGTVIRNGARFALRETAGVLYPLDSAGRAWPFEGEDVRVTGKLDLDTRLLYVDAIESAML